MLHNFSECEKYSVNSNNPVNRYKWLNEEMFNIFGNRKFLESCNLYLRCSLFLEMFA